MAVKTVPFDPAEFLDTEEAQAVYLDEAFATGDLAFISKSLGVVARARVMTDIAKGAGVSRESLYRALSKGGNPELGTLLKVIGAMGLQLRVAKPEPVVITDGFGI